MRQTKTVQQQQTADEFLGLSTGTLVFGFITALVLIALIMLAWVELLDFIRRLKVRRSTNKARESDMPYKSVVIAGEWIPDEARVRHTHIVGATGSGKTVLLEQLIYEDLARGFGAVIIDPKGDRELYERIRTFCKKTGRASDLHLLSASHINESARWNPCRLGNASELQSKWFNSGVYSEPFYAKACELVLLEAFNKLIKESPKGFTPVCLVRELKELAAEKKERHFDGLYYDLQNFIMGEWGQILCASPDEGTLATAPEISLFDICRKKEILFVDLPTEVKTVQSARVGKLLLQELMLISGLRKLYPDIRTDRPFSIFIDEFDAFASESFITFLNKGRSSRFMIHIAHQTLGDLEKVSPTFQAQVMGNTAVRFVFRQDHPDDAETWARFFGTQTVSKTTYRTEGGVATGDGSSREVQEFLVHPDLIKNLPVGTCIYSNKLTGTLMDLRPPFPPSYSGRRVNREFEREPTSFKTAAVTKDFDRVTRDQWELLQSNAAMVKKTVRSKNQKLEMGENDGYINRCD